MIAHIEQSINVVFLPDGPVEHAGFIPSAAYPPGTWAYMFVFNMPWGCVSVDEFGNHEWLDPESLDEVPKEYRTYMLIRGG